MAKQNPSATLAASTTTAPEVTPEVLELLEALKENSPEAVALAALGTLREHRTYLAEIEKRLDTAHLALETANEMAENERLRAAGLAQERDYAEGRAQKAENQSLIDRRERDEALARAVAAETELAAYKRAAEDTKKPVPPSPAPTPSPKPSRPPTKGQAQPQPAPGPKGESPKRASRPLRVQQPKSSISKRANATKR